MPGKVIFCAGGQPEADAPTRLWRVPEHAWASGSQDLTPRTYERYSIAAELLDLGAHLCLFIWLLTGPGIALRTFASHISSRPWAVIALFTLGLSLLMAAVSFPISVFSGYALPRHMGLSRESFLGWIRDAAKAWAIGLILGTGITEMLYALLRYFPRVWWLYAAVGIFVFMIVMAVLTPVIFVPIFFRTTPLKNRPLRERLRALARKARVRITGVYEFDLGRKTRAANAALTGLGRTRRILLSDTLLKAFTLREIETVLAHELGHHAGSHLWKGIIVNGVLTLLGLFIVDRSFSLLLPHFSFLGPHDVANLPLLALILGAAGIMTVPLANAASRRMERTADLFCLHLTGRPRAFVSAMRKLARLNLANPDPHPLVEVLFYSHPSVRKRIALAQSPSP